MTVEKSFDFAAAHMLSNYEGKCKNLHGHTYKVTVYAEFDGLDEYGFAMDFNEIGEIKGRFDHAVIFSAGEYRDKAEEEIRNVCIKYGLRHIVITRGRCTTENIALTIRDYLVGANPFGRYTVRVSEGPTTCAEVTNEDEDL